MLFGNKGKKSPFNQTFDPEIYAPGGGFGGGMGQHAYAAATGEPQQQKGRSGLKKALGIFSEAARGFLGQEGPGFYAQTIAREREAEQAEAQYQRQRADSYADWERKERFEMANKPPETTALQKNYEWLLANDPAAAKSYMKRMTDPIQWITGNDGIPRPYSIGGGEDAPDTLPADFFGQGGATTPGTPPFARSAGVAGDRLDHITMMSESGGNPNAVSPKGARGLMQVMPATARDPGFGIRPSNGTPEDDVRVGKEYRRAMQQRYNNNLPRMWAAYNAGPGRVDDLIERYGERWLDYAPAETRAYVARNMRAARGN